VSAEIPAPKPNPEVERAENAASAFGAMAYDARDLVEAVTDHKDTARIRALPWAALSVDRRESVSADVEDVVAFEQWGTPEQFAWSGMSPDFKLGIHAILQDYRDALPFTAAERRWAVQTPYRAGAEEFASARTDIVDRGRRRQITGNDMLKRWWDFRRGGGEFSHGRSAFPEMVGALTQLVELIDPNLTPKLPAA
jgi:hypothetical protein